MSLQVNDFNAWYDDFHAIKHINMNVPKHKVTAFIGPSGCGKSTFLRCINRMHEVIPGTKISGEINFEGSNIYNRNIDPVEIRQRFGMVFQKPNPFPTMSIYDNVVAGLKLKGVRKKKRLDEVVETSLKAVGLWEEVKDRLTKNSMGLSGGQQQRLCIARTIAINPEVVLMDEPTSALDPISTAKIEELITELKKQYTIVIVTHNMQQASRISDQTAFFLLGDLIEINDTEKIFSQPEHQRTEDYISGRFG
ncbi:phosphate ABC transporter ATP-binding protein PstB [Bacillus fonticola]|uniref:phosphate ABC transporter ATP-binding protein PstB n=1 Tax=Bacillus fonticola TaxID=2728853 RepID=UPI001473A657|nr:phosphate ABC transporter ATP-binding protein PstB [Bacillus fonticola]